LEQEVFKMGTYENKTYLLCRMARYRCINFRIL
jgi:hypothetical protein